ncbi:hypothetical protein FSP39_013520 [Pinctada imbricata]|uniref:Alpha-1,3-mannosyl-glycoprotein 2-beta-N-acetylglucosaminyltransferase n=1 Tax=Pinctada imbricata TaxID=66713 RepID=A0AA88YDG7_PINIB|nr:hypothetical protein FSP39_013520 [Pinctada imbricata]
MVHSGNGDKEMPKICANGKMLMDKDLNNAGRGFNVAIIDSSTKQPKLVSRFDTYETDSIDMEFQLESMSPGDIVIAVVSDDGSRKLTQNCKETLNELGSSMIQNLRFRDVWYFIGQKDIGGFTLLEQISYAGFDGDWPTPIHESVCVPKKVPSSKIPPSPKSARNLDRRNFCKNYDGYVDFCDPAHIDEKLTTVELLDKSKEKDKIFKTPMVIVPGMDHNAVVRTMETTLMQPGINPKMVLVTFDESFKEFGELATLFGFRNKSLSTSESYEEQMIKAIEEAWKVFDKSDYLIVIEEELILATDFLSFMSNCLSALESDSSLHGATAWNYNGYETTSKDKSVVYRMNDFPGLAFLLPKKIYKKFMKDGMQKCCNKRAWEGWYLSKDFTPVILGPDISRVYRQPYQSMDLLNNDLTELFHKPRQTNLDGEVTVFTHTSDSYDKEIKKLLTQSANMSPKDITKCIEQKNFHPETDAISKSTVAIYYHQDQIDDYFTLRQLCKCFGLYYIKTKPPKNLYKGIIRFYYKDKHYVAGWICFSIFQVQTKR